jgi:hypothetical protein
MISLRETIDAAKARLPLPSLFSALGLEEHAQTSARCPLHEDSRASFSVWHGPHGWRWKCHAGCGEGDEIAFLEKLLSLSKADAIQHYLSLSGQPMQCEAATIRRPSEPTASSGPSLPDDATPGTEADRRALAQLRGLRWVAPAMAAELGTLYFGTVCGQRCWIVTDERRLCAEARRMDGRMFAAHGDLGERKAHTIRGSVKSWPVGLSVRRFGPADFRALLVVEGGPDYLAALHFVLDGKLDCLPIAFLGAGTAGTIHPEALARFRGLRTRFYSHADAAGSAAFKKWGAQFEKAGASVDGAFDFSGLRKADGAAVKDLNDCTQIHPDDAAELEGLLP